MLKQIINNIGSVAKYESKLLSRSWFFKIYLAFVVGLLLYMYGNLTNIGETLYMTTPTILPYNMILFLNILQSAIIIFMSADYLKRDKQLDTSEVFYVRPLSNAEYLFGKVLGTIKPFLITDICASILLFVVSKYGFSVDANLIDYFQYICIIIIPSLIFFIGVSTGIMLLIGNQAITYIVMLAISAISITYAGNYFGYIFDMFALNIPLGKSDVLGITNIAKVLPQRVSYVLVGFSAMLYSVYMFNRLANSHAARRFFLILSLVAFGLSGLWVSKYIADSFSRERTAQNVMELNSEYADMAAVNVIEYEINVEQQPYTLLSKMRIWGKLAERAEEVVFNLNSGMDVTAVTLADYKPLEFRREGHLIIVKLDREYDAEEDISIRFEYSGDIDEREMYVDIDNIESDYDNKTQNLLNYDRRCSYLEPKWVVLTPESGWYVRPGVTYTKDNPNWRKDLFSFFTLNVTPMDGMTPVSQGEPVLSQDSTSYNFMPEDPMREMSLLISRYKRFNTKVEDLEYSLYLHESNVKCVEFLEEVDSTELVEAVNDLLGDYERNNNTYYHLPRLSIIDAPEDLFTYNRDWRSIQELGQPEMMIVPAMGAAPAGNLGMYSYNWGASYAGMMKWIKYNNYFKKMSDTERRLYPLRSLQWRWSSGNNISYSWSRTKGLVMDMEANSHFLTSILFNSRYNIISDSLMWGNQLLEMYAISYEKSVSQSNNARAMLGMTPFEQALSLATKRSVNDYIGDKEYSQYITPMMLVGGNILFSEAICNMGYEEFFEELKEVIEGSEFDNINMGVILDSISVRSGVDVRKNFEKLSQPLELPYYEFGGMKAALGYVGDEEMYASELVAKNGSDHTGYIEIAYNAAGETEKVVVELLPHQIKRIVKHTTAIPRISINTLNSANIPQSLNLGTPEVASNKMANMKTSLLSEGGRGPGSGGGPSGGGGRGGGGGGGRSGGGSMAMMSGGGRMMGGGGPQREEQQDKTSMVAESNLTPEGAYVIEEFEFKPKNEIVVDNEDEELFAVSDRPASGYLNRIVDMGNDNHMEYRSISTWQAPYYWALTSGQQFYGDHILSAMNIKGGDGSQYVEWTIPVEKGKRYSLYFSTMIPDDVRQMNDPRRRQHMKKNADLSYNFTIDNGKEEAQTLKFDMKKLKGIKWNEYGWEWLGDYNAEQDTITIRLSNKSDLRQIIADAVKAVEIVKNK